MKRIKDLLGKTLYVLTPVQRKLCILVFLMTCIGSLLECLGVSVIIPLISVIQDPEVIRGNALFQKSEWLISLDYNQIITLIVILVIAVYVLKNLYFILQSWVRVKFSCKIRREMSVKMMTSLLSRGYQYFLNVNYGEYSRSVSGDASAIYDVINGVFRLASETLTITLIALFMFVTDWQLALAVLALSLICLVLIYFIFRKRVFRAGIRNREYYAKTGQAMNQSYYGIKDVMLLQKQKYFIYEYEKNNIETQKALCSITVGSESPSYIIEGICVSGLMLAVCVKVVFMGSGPEFIGILAAFAVGAFRILPSLSKISGALNQLTSTIPMMSALYDNVVKAEEYAREHPEAALFAQNTKNTTKLISRGTTFDFDEKKTVFSSGKFKDKLELKNVSFAYDTEYGNVLDNINLTINKGQAIALIGESGAGKSTLVDVLLGLLVPNSGEILIDNTPITSNPEKWASTIGYVPQSVFLCDDSIRKNVAFGERDEDIDDELVMDALTKAELHDFINSLPEGLDTEVGDRGVRLSGGQRQRIAIARALYHRPEILVLDEATSALDNDTESAIMSAINSLYGQVTMVIVAHRLTTVRNCDVIYEVGHGAITEKDKSTILKDYA